MDDQRFDDIVRAFGGGSSRRAVVRRLGGGLAGLFVGAASREAAGAAERRGRDRVRAGDSPQRLCKQAGRPCSFDTHCCSFETANGAPVCCRKRCCGEGRTCVGGRCVCTPAEREVTCGDQLCGSVTNNCGQLTDCSPLCAADDGNCLLNDSCAQACAPGGDECPEGCGCGQITAEGGFNCVNSQSCIGLQSCTGTGDCDPGYQCQECFNGKRCAALCGTVVAAAAGTRNRRGAATAPDSAVAG